MGGQAQGGGEYPMTEAEVRKWIDACNHEPARQVLRDYLRLRTAPPSAPVGVDMLNDLHLIAEQGETPDGDGVTVNVQLWAERWVDRIAQQPAVVDGAK